MQILTKGGWIVGRSKGAVTQDQIDELTRVRGDQLIRDIFFFMLQLTGADNLPGNMLNKHVCSKAFNYRSDQVGDRLKRIIGSGLFTTNLSATFDDFGPYDIVWEGQRAAVVKYCNGDKAIIDGEGEFTNSFTKHLWHQDSDAFVKGSKKLSLFHMKDYFEPGKGPFKTALLSDTLKDFAAQAAKDISAVKEELSKDTVKACSAMKRGICIYIIIYICFYMLYAYVYYSYKAFLHMRGRAIRGRGGGGEGGGIDWGGDTSGYFSKPQEFSKPQNSFQSPTQFSQPRHALQSPNRIFQRPNILDKAP